MILRTGPSRAAARLAALALGCALVAGGCSDGGTEPADEQAEPAASAASEEDDLDAAQDEEAAPDEAEQDEQAAPVEDEQDEAPDDDDAPDDEAAPDDQAATGDAAGDCVVDVGTVNDIVDVGVEIAFDDVNELANDGISCMYDGENDDVSVIVSVSVGTWDGTDERVEGVVSQTAEYFDDPVATPDLGDQAFLFDDDFGGTSLVVFVDDLQYSIGIGGAGFDGTSLDSFEERQSMASELYGAASG